MNQFRAHFIAPDCQLTEALRRMNGIAKGFPLVLFVIDKYGKVVGSVTDGDIRRAIISGANLESKVSVVMNKNFHYLNDKFDFKKIHIFKNLDLKLIPHISKAGKLIGIVNLKQKRTQLPIDAIIMAGGKGLRLQPYTNDIPKPMLPLRDKPIIAHNIERMYTYGIENFHISVNHMKEPIIKYISEKYGHLNIDFIEEESPLGTIGSVKLVKKFSHSDVILINADILTNIDFEDYFTTYKASKADMSVAATATKVDIPYAVLETHGKKITGFIEKPTYNYYSNAGIYLFGKKNIELIPKNVPYNATDLISSLVLKKKLVTYFPIVGYWLDIGTAQNYSKAKNDIDYIKF